MTGNNIHKLGFPWTTRFEENKPGYASVYVIRDRNGNEIGQFYCNAGSSAHFICELTKQAAGVSTRFDRESSQWHASKEVSPSLFRNGRGETESDAVRDCLAGLSTPEWPGHDYKPFTTE